MTSILTSIKKSVGIDESDTSFDDDIIMHINSTLMTLNQLGVGPSEGFIITDKSEVWSDLLGDDIRLEAAKSLMMLEVRMLFDPPQAAYAVTAAEKLIVKYTWKVNTQVELIKIEVAEALALAEAAALEESGV